MKDFKSCKKFMVIGNPIDHSFSPVIHNANFKKLNIDASYSKLLVTDIKDIRNYCSRNNISGFNVTLPFKESVIPMLDELDVPSWCHAINTVRISDDFSHYVGFNTDIYGILKDFEVKGIQYKGKKILILGYGGLGKTLSSLFDMKADVTVANRSAKDGVDVVACPQQMIDMFLHYDLIINTTKIGSLDDNSLNLDNVRQFNGYFYDCSPNKSKITERISSETNGKTYNGLGMLIYQAAKSFEIWFGRRANVESMKKALGM